MKTVPHHTILIGKKILIIGYFGGWASLSKHEYMDFLTGKTSKKTTMLRDPMQIAERYRNLNCSLFLKPTLHIINLTNECTNRCSYCHVSHTQSKMDIQTADKVIEFILGISGNDFVIEFQGGEPLCNWEILSYIVEKIRKNTQYAHITLVSNLSLLTEDRLDFLTANKISICTSLDGPAQVHDHCRKTMRDEPTFTQTVSRIHMVKAYYHKKRIKRHIHALTTVTKKSLKYWHQIIDTYVGLGLPMIHLRPIDRVGDAGRVWQDLGITADEFILFWKKSMDYILELNRGGVMLLEKNAYNLLMKIYDHDPMAVEMMPLTGMGRSCLVYDFNGVIYGSDEGRMLSEDIFRIGTVDDTHDILLKEPNQLLIQSSFIDLYAYASAFRPFMGIHPGLVYSEQGTVIPSIYEHSAHKVMEAQLYYLFQKLTQSKAIFNKWLGFRFR